MSSGSTLLLTNLSVLVQFKSEREKNKRLSLSRVQEVTVDLGLGYRHTTAIVGHDVKRQETRVKKGVGPGPGMVVREERNKTSHRVGICRPGARQPATNLSGSYVHVRSTMGSGGVAWSRDPLATIIGPNLR